MPPRTALDAVLNALRCPVCTGPIAATPPGSSVLGCPDGHRFDIARQGYVALLGGRSAGLSSDTADMIAARRAALSTPPYRQLREAVAEAVGSELGQRAQPLVVDAGCGTGQYLASVLDRCPHALGIGLDLSKYAARSVARCHPRAAGIVADLWQPWPLADGCADAVLAVFAPRGYAQARRVLGEDGIFVVVTPRADHLRELIEPMGMLGVADDKHDQVRAALVTAGFASVHVDTVARCDEWSCDDVVNAVAMGPSAFHAEPGALRERAAALCGDSATVTVTTAVDITVARS